MGPVVGSVLGPRFVPVVWVVLSCLRPSLLVSLCVSLDSCWSICVNVLLKILVPLWVCRPPPNDPFWLLSFEIFSVVC